MPNPASISVFVVGVLFAICSIWGDRDIVTNNTMITKINEDVNKLRYGRI